MNDVVRRELLLALGNTLLLKLTADALKEGKLTSAQFEVIARCMEMLLQAYEVAYPVSALDATVDDKVTKH